MRVSKEKLEFLKKIIESAIDNVDIYIFGSRVESEKKGGDIDVLVLADKKISLIKKMQIKIKFWKKFGEQKIDIVSYTRNQESTFKNLILQSAIKI